MQRLEGKIAVVTGAGKGIGRAIAIKYASEGASVICCDINGAAAESCVENIRENGGDAVAVRTDVSDKASITNLVDVSMSAFGQVDIVCNNAGILDDFTPLGDVTDELWASVIGVNLTGCFMVSRAFLPQMLERGSGTFVNIASMAGLIAHAGGLAYTVSKHGVIGLTRQVSADYGQKGIRANAICPGAIETDLTRDFFQKSAEVLSIAESVPAGRQGLPEEIAELAVYLGSDASSFVHGAAMVIDGGWTIR